MRRDAGPSTESGAVSLFAYLPGGRGPRAFLVRVGAVFLLGSAAYWFCLRYLFPGYFAPLAPNHSDLYTAVGFLERSLAEVLTYPRPLTYVFLRTAGLLGVQGSILVVVLAAIASVLLVGVLTVRWAGVRASWWGLTCYLVLAFGHPEFYFEHRHDSPGVLSCGLVMLAAECWRRWLVRDGWGYLAGCCGLTLSLGLVKETYYPSLLILLVMLAVLERRWQWRRVLPAIGGVCALLALAFLISAAGFRRWMPAGAESYHISLAPAEVWRSFTYYLAHLFTWAGALVTVVPLALLVRHRRRILCGGGVALAGMAALLPNSVLPNHVLQQYAWLAAPFCFASLLLVASASEGGPPAIAGAEPHGRTRSAIFERGVVVALTVLALWSYRPEYASAAHRWSIRQEEENRAIMQSFERLRAIPPGGRVLITGVDTPLSPWIEPDFLKHDFGAHEWTVVIPLERPALDLPGVHLVHAASVQPADFDFAFVYDERGRLQREYDHAALAAVAAENRPETLAVPQLAPLAEQMRRSPGDNLALLKAADLCLTWGLDGLAEQYLLRSLELTGGKDPYGYFFLGKLKERQQDLAGAYADYQRAVKTDQEPRNPLFVQAADRLRKAVR